MQGLVDAFAKAKAAMDTAEAHYKAIKTEFETRGLLVPDTTLYGDRYSIKLTASFPKRFVPDECEKVMGKGWLDQFKFAKDTPEWRYTVKEVTVITSATADQVAAL
jgi:hypothetical protein